MLEHRGPSLVVFLAPLVVSRTFVVPIVWSCRLHARRTLLHILVNDGCYDCYVDYYHLGSVLTNGVHFQVLVCTSDSRLHQRRSSYDEWLPGGSVPALPHSMGTLCSSLCLASWLDRRACRAERRVVGAQVVGARMGVHVGHGPGIILLIPPASCPARTSPTPSCVALALTYGTQQWNVLFVSVPTFELCLLHASRQLRTIIGNCYDLIVRLPPGLRPYITRVLFVSMLTLSLIHI